MLTTKQEKRIKSLHAKKGRQQHGECIVEGQKVIDTAGSAIVWTFTREDSKNFDKLVTTKTPQDVAGVAKIPTFTLDDVQQKKTIVVLDGVQDPGNVGAVLRLCLGFGASLLLVESADVASPKVVRSSVGAMFHVPWMVVKRADAVEVLASLDREIYKMEGGTKTSVDEIGTDKTVILIAGSEGSGIKLDIDGTSVSIPHAKELESLNVANALAIALYERR